MKTFSQQAFTKIPRVLQWFTFAAIAIIGTAVQAQVPVPVFTNLWVVPAGTYPGLPADNNTRCRGVAISPVTTNVLYFSAIGGVNNGVAHVGTLAFTNGSNFLANLEGSSISGGTVLTEGVRVADDGTVYAINLSGGVASTFKIYKWPSDTDTTTPTEVVANIPNGSSFTWRAGDYMDLRGSGASTEMVVVGNGSGAAITTNFVIFRPTDAACTNFTNFSITIPGSAAGVFTNYCGAGVAFEGTNNAIWIRRSGSAETRRISYDPDTLTATCDRTNAVDQTVCQGLKYYSANGVGYLATVQAATAANALQRARVFQIPTNPTAPLVSVLNVTMPITSTGSQNGNGLGNVDAKNGYFAFGAPGHGIAFYSVSFITNSPPGVTLSSANPTTVEGFTNTLTATATGSAPLSYLWFFNNGTTNQIPGATTNIYTIGPAQLTNAGRYFVVVTNPYGSATSAVSTFTVLPGKFTGYATNLWSLAPGTRPYLTTSDTQRGVAYDAVSNSLVVVSRTPSNAVYLLDASTGADLGVLDTSVIFSATPPGTLPINMVGVADDGVVYVGNLITSGASDNFTLYRWNSANTTDIPTQAYLGNPGITRIGDTISVRGSGVNTEILCSFRTGTNVALFTTGDGFNFTPTVIPVTNLPDVDQTNGFAGLGLAFGPTNTFWAKSSGFSLRQVAIDTNTATAQVVATYTNLPVSEAPLGADNVNGIVATVAFGQNPQNLSIWDVSGGEPDAVQLDRELFGSSNANANGTGAVAVDVAGGRIFALDSNNGLIALAYPPKLFIARETLGGIVTWTGPGALQSSTNLTGPYSDVLGATSPHTNTAADQIFFRVLR